MAAVIISHGTIRDYEFHKGIIKQDDLVICADGGAAHARKMGIEPDVILGDFDSLRECDLDSFKEAEILTFPRNKDKTDTELAVDYAVAKGEKRIIMLGSTGTRLDHTLSNIFLLKTMLDKGVRGEIINENNRIFLISDTAKISGRGTIVSLVPLSTKVTGITLRGFKYPLENETIEIGSSRGVSNVLVEETGEISLSGGLLLVVEAKD
ncbi:MAG: thiamine pyrophosphokinase [Firmicutes bacterium]|nr:thiamine pyrophosphokinase [Bacillota bacterium]MDI6705482.1 thiamine diphosphokinase [Bacillota bacterium]